MMMTDRRAGFPSPGLKTARGNTILITRHRRPNACSPTACPVVITDDYNERWIRLAQRLVAGVVAILVAESNVLRYAGIAV